MTLLDTLLELTGIQVAEAMNGLELGELDSDGWVQQMGQVLASHHLAAFLAGAGDAELDDVGRRYLRRFLGAQFRFLERFGVEVQSAEEFQAGWRARAQMYARAIRAPYEKGRTKVLPLPAMPGDGTTQCKTNCKCSWEIDWLDRDAGDADCYWRLGNAEHCQTCVARARRWNPLRVRGGRIQR